MLLNYNNGGYSWGRFGKVYYGFGGKAKALKDGIRLFGISEFRKLASSSASQYSIENTIADYRGTTRDGTNESEDDSPDITGNQSTQGYITQEERNKVATDDFGWPAEHKYPIRNQSDLDAAARLIGRAPKEMQDSIRRRIKGIARRKGLTLPDSWVSE